MKYTDYLFVAWCWIIMKIIETIKKMQEFSREVRGKGKSVALVPTMGFLHEGHLSLVDEAQKRADIVVVSIFINPTQFAPNEDLDIYPRDMEKDCRLCESRNVDVIFAPSVDEIYCPDSSTWVNEEQLSRGLCGKSRPTHFRGVTTIVAKLFNTTLPDIAIFGQKDFQQAAIIKRMIRDLNFPIDIITCPIVREEDGLAMSSRNKFLSPEERKNALSISQSLSDAEIALKTDTPTVSEIREMIHLQISQAGGKINYIEIVDADTLEPKEEFTGQTLIAIAAFFGKTRLIDNIVV